jgi:hypothetical protein
MGIPARRQMVLAQACPRTRAQARRELLRACPSSGHAPRVHATRNTLPPIDGIKLALAPDLSQLETGQVANPAASNNASTKDKVNGGATHEPRASPQGTSQTETGTQTMSAASWAH